AVSLAKVVAPSPPPWMTPPGAGVAQAPTTSAPAPSTAAPASKGVPPQSGIAECNRVAGDMSGPERTRNEKVVNAAKDAGIGALGGAAVGALGGGIAGGG